MPPLLMYGASQGEAAKSGYSKIPPSTFKVKDSNAVKFLCQCKSGYPFELIIGEERLLLLKAIGLSALLARSEREGSGVSGINVYKKISNNDDDCKNFTE